MCGISGAISTQMTNQHKKVVSAIIQSQISRGPDHHDVVTILGKNTEVLLGHNRLSIIDLTENSNQPMWDATARYCIVFNGEIYNYLELKLELEKLGLIFNTYSDTEVILNAFAYWGIECLHRFYGPFAFGLYDSHQEELWLCRDRFGIRPLYYVETGNVLYFASTTNQLARSLNLKPNYSYLAKGLKYLVYEDDSDTSAYKNMISLLPGSYLTANLHSNGRLSSSTKVYYNLANNVQGVIESLTSYNDADYMALVKNYFEESVKIRLRTDVPLAISLSGGLDSSSIASLVSRQHPNTIGFSFGHPNNKNSEGPLVAQCAKFLNIKMEYIWPNADEMIEAFYRTIDIQDAPFSSLSIVAQNLLYKHVRAAGIKVLLGGQGGDEVFMGYRKFLFFWIKQLFSDKRYFKTVTNALQLLPIFVSEMSSLKAYWHHRHRYLRHNSQFSTAIRLHASPTMNLNHSKNLLWKRQMQDITQSSLPTLLRYEDRNAMGNSVESRLPYMDHRLVELGLALPERTKLRSGYGKWIIREMMQKQIPDTIRLARYKRGFDIPLNSLLQSGLGQSIRSTLTANKSMINDFLNESISIEQIFSDQQFIQRRQTMSEAITLLWMTKVLI